jgi:signal peptidase I
MRRLVRRIVEVLFAAVVVGTLGLAAATYLAPAAGLELFAVRSGSMRPALEVGDLVVARHVEPSAIEPGDVITIAAGRSVVTHRVVAVHAADDGPVFTTRGDANAAPDPLAARTGQLRGRADWHVPFLGLLLAMIAMPVGIVGVISIAAALLTAAWLLDEDGSPEPESSAGDEPVPDLGAPAPSAG